MTKFVKANFDMGSGSERWVNYGTPDTAWKDRRFVARFKYARPGTNSRDFVKFLIANFTVEEYFEAMDKGETPLMILKTKGYVSPNEIAAREAQARYERSQRPMILIDVTDKIGAR